MKELSKKNSHYISKHRMLELRHWCYQYFEWDAEYMSLMGIKAAPTTESPRVTVTPYSPVESTVLRMEKLKQKMDLVKHTCMVTDPELANYIFAAVTKEGVTYETLYTQYEIPCCRKTYYERYRRFFYLLSLAK